MVTSLSPGWHMDSAGLVWREPPCPYCPYQEDDLRSYSAGWPPPDPATTITVTIDPAKLARALHPDRPEAMRAEEV